MLKKRFFKTKNECEVTFEYAGDADKVVVVYDANDWQPVEMKKNKTGFSVKVRLPMDGRYQYLYLVNGEQWVTDPAADSYEPNEFGGNNAVVETYAG